MPLKNQTDPLPISLVLAFLFELGAGTLSWDVVQSFQITFPFPTSLLAL
jgi:hypothetical protein